MIRRWLKLRVRARYWKRRALKAELELSDAMSLLDAEVIRNRYREDTFASAAVLGQRGMYGLPPREGPALQRPQPHVPTPTYGVGWDAGFNWADKEEFKLEYLPAVDAGLVSLQKAQQDFAQLVASRRTPLNDEPFPH